MLTPTGGEIHLNGFLPLEKLKAKNEAAREWWAKNRDTFTLRRAEPYSTGW